MTGTMEPIGAKPHHDGSEPFIRLNLPLLLPDVADERDRCVARLIRLLEWRDGIAFVHVVEPGEVMPPGAEGERRIAHEPQLCLHYDPERVSLTQVEELARFAGAQVSDRFAHVVIPFHAVGSEDDGRRIEESLRALRGVTTAAVNFAGQVARVEFDRRVIDPRGIERAMADVGAKPLPAAERIPLAPAEAEKRRVIAAAPTRLSWYRRNRELAWSFISGLLLGAGWLSARFAAGQPNGASGLSLVLYLGAYAFGARDNVGHFIKDLRRGRMHFNIDLLMVVAAAGAAILGAWFEGALLLFLFSLGHALEHYALGRARHAIRALAELAPDIARVQRPDGSEEIVSITDVRPGDLVVVRPAERLPVDGIIREGTSSVNQAPITGESMPVTKVTDDHVYAGSVNGEGALVIEVTVAVGDRTLDRVVKLVAEAETQKAPTQQFTDRFERIFVPTVLIGDALFIIVPPLVGWLPWTESFYRAMALLVAASPCALALGTPAAVLAGIAQAARRGVLIKGGAHLENLGNVDILALDKTGTITLGEPTVTDMERAPGVSETQLLATAAAVERRSQHPLARAVVSAAESRRLRIPASSDLQSVTSRGVRATVGDTRVEIGRLLMFEEARVSVPREIVDSVARLEERGRTTMIVRQTTPARGDGATPEWLGVLGVSDEPRPAVRETLDWLRHAGIKRIIMLTGDNARVGNAVGQAVGVDEVRAELMPEDKLSAVRELAAEGRVAMVGDGVNDAPALAHATVGIAMGGAGTAAALETADVALMGDDLAHLHFAIGLSRKARAIIQQNLFVSLAVIVLLVVATLSGIARIGPAVIVHEGSTLAVIGNALRLLSYRGEA